MATRGIRMKQSIKQNKSQTTIINQQKKQDRKRPNGRQKLCNENKERKGVCTVQNENEILGKGQLNGNRDTRSLLP